MPTTIAKSYTFEAAHYLPNVQDGHKCRRLHGHSYTVWVEVTGEVDPVLGWVMDFGDLSKIMKPIIDGELDHRFLNEDIVGLENPTAENIARWMWNRVKPLIPGLSKVRISETCTSACEYSE